MSKLKLITPINPLGYGVAGYNISKALLKQRTDLHIHLIGECQVEPDEALKKAIEDGIFHYDNDRPVVKIWHQHALAEIPFTKNKYYGFPIFELDTFSEVERCHLAVPDELIVSSQWAKEIIHNNLPAIHDSNVHVIPLGVDRDIFYAKAPVKPEGTYKFFTIGKLEYRKGHEFVVKCFHEAFDRNDDVELNMMINNPFLQKGVIDNWKSGFQKGKLGSKINFIPPVMSHGHVADFIRSQDCGLFPARAEGWNLELLESMSCGKPVITTDYSAHTEFCNKDNAYLIDITDTEPAHDKMGGMWFRGQGNWAELDYEQEEQMIEHMRCCYKERPNNPDGQATANQFTWDNSAKKLLEIL